jgi:hypothetical protein
VLASQCYHLPRHVYACRTDDGLVFLDTRHDRYFGLGGERVGALPELILNWPDRDRGQWKVCRPPAASADLIHLADSLVRRGLLCRGDAVDPRRNDKVLPSLAMDPPRYASERCRSPHLADLANFMLACSKALWLLKRSSLEAIASCVSASRPEKGRFDLAEALRLVQVFRRLRSLLFSEKDRCHWCEDRTVRRPQLGAAGTDRVGR